MKLSQRLEAVIGMVSKGSIAFDVGCDHAFTAIELVERGICPFAAASDIREGPLLAAGQHIRERGLEAKIRTYLSDGVPEHPDRIRGGFPGGDGAPLTLITAGMGGLMMCGIMKKAGRDLELFSEYVSSPQRNPGELRKELRKAGFLIKDEKMIIEEGKYYPVIRAVRERNGSFPLYNAGEAEEQEACDLYGPVLISRKDEVLLRFLRKERNRLLLVESELGKSSAAGKRKAEVEKLLACSKAALRMMGALDDESIG